MKVGFLTKPDKLGVDEAVQYTQRKFENVTVWYGEINDTIPADLHDQDLDLLISYLSPWIIPGEILEKTKLWNINYHPGPPGYPGIGCYNFAIYNSETQFGVTAHIMNPEVDTGKIFQVLRFPMGNDETVESLMKKTYLKQLDLYKQTIDYIIRYNSLPHCDEMWTRKPYNRHELEDLATISPSMSSAEITLRIRSTYYPGKPGPFIEINGNRFEYNPDR